MFISCRMEDLVLGELRGTVQRTTMTEH